MNEDNHKNAPSATARADSENAPGAAQSDAPQLGCGSGAALCSAGSGAADKQMVWTGFTTEELNRSLIRQIESRIAKYQRMINLAVKVQKMISSDMSNEDWGALFKGNFLQIQ